MEHLADEGPIMDLLQLEKPDQTISYFELSDENKCNWMMFVRPAASYSEQNLVAYQHGQDVFFSVIKNIEARQELKVSVLLLRMNHADPCNSFQTMIHLGEGGLISKYTTELFHTCRGSRRVFHPCLQLNFHS